MGPWTRLIWHNPLGIRGIQSAFLGQIKQNAPSQPKVDQRSKLVKTIPKQHFSCFYIKPKLFGDFCPL